MDKTLLLFRPGIRSFTKKLVDGNEHTIHCVAKYPDETALFIGAMQRVSNDEAGDRARQKLRAQFIASSLCNEDGTPLLTVEEAAMIPASEKPDWCNKIMEASDQAGERGNG